MSRQSHPITIEERSGESYPDLDLAQRAALHPLASDLAATLRALLASGALQVEAGQIILPPRKDANKQA
jgi:hypothetical protein